MFMPETSPHDVLWQGEVAGVEEAKTTFRADEAYPIRMLQKILPGLIKSSSQLFHNVNTVSTIYTDMETFQKAVQSKKVKDSSCITHEARWKKSEEQVRLMRTSAAIACQVLELEPGKNEIEKALRVVKAEHQKFENGILQQVLL